MATITTPGGTARQISYQTGGMSFGLAVVAKRTYTVTDDGACVVAAEQVPLHDTPVMSSRDPRLMERDIDLVPAKPLTDLIVLGHAYAGGKQGAVAEVAVGSRRKRILVVGDRRASLSATGHILISAADAFERMPLSFLAAYGGRDRAAEAKHGNPFAALAPFLRGTGIDADGQSPFLYPRNPCGKGYLIESTREGLERCELPNLEDPEDPLTAERLVTGHPARWIYMPVPQGLGWVTWGWFPRLAWMGIFPDYEKLDRAIPEIQKGLLPSDVLAGPPKDLQARATPHAARIANGAPLDLQLRHLAPDVEIELSHLHPRKKRWLVKLPGERPTIKTDGRNGKLNATDPVIQSVTIEPDDGRVTVVWRGSAPALRPYFPDELAKMPLLVEW